MSVLLSIAELSFVVVWSACAKQGGTTKPINKTTTAATKCQSRIPWLPPIPPI
jgi:hypothetical protein